MNARAAPPAILVVESNAVVRAAIGAYLRDCGLTVVEAIDGREAKTIASSGMAIDVAFIDLAPPGELQGFELAHWLRRHRPDVKIVLTSGISKTAREAHELCGEGSALNAPFSPRELEQKIRWLLAQ